MQSLHLVSMMCLALGADDRPKALVEFEQSRRALVSGRVEWTLVFADNHTSRGELRFRNRFARNGDLLFEELGDRDGWTAWDGRGRGRSIAPQLFMINHDGFWYRPANDIAADLWRGARNAQEHLKGRPKDIRSLGFTSSDACLNINEGGQRMWLAWPRDNGSVPAVKWRERVADGMYEVTATAADDRSQRIWVLDPKRGWNPTRVVVKTADGATQSEAVLALKQYGDVWFPQSVAFYEPGGAKLDETGRALSQYDSRMTLRRTINVTSAAFNAKDDPARLTGADLGLEVGNSVQYRGGPPSKDFPGDRIDFWLGDRAVRYEVLWKLVKDGKVELGPVSAALYRGEDPPMPYTTAQEREEYIANSRELRYQMWKQSAVYKYRQFTGEMAAAVDLSAPQRASVDAILQECVAKAGKYVDSRKVEFIDNENKRQKAIKDKDHAAIEQLNRQKRELEAPIQEFLEQDLKPRALAVLTTKQRAEWESRSTTTRPTEK